MRYFFFLFFATFVISGCGGGSGGSNEGNSSVSSESSEVWGGVLNGTSINDGIILYLNFSSDKINGKYETTSLEYGKVTGSIKDGVVSLNLRQNSKCSGNFNINGIYYDTINEIIAEFKGQDCEDKLISGETRLVNVSGEINGDGYSGYYLGENLGDFYFFSINQSKDGEYIGKSVTMDKEFLITRSDLYGNIHVEPYFYLENTINEKYDTYKNGEIKIINISPHFSGYKISTTWSYYRFDGSYLSGTGRVEMFSVE